MSKYIYNRIWSKNSADAATSANFERCAKRGEHAPVAGLTGGLWPVAGHRSPVACGRSPVAGSRSPVACGRSPVACGWSPVACGRSPGRAPVAPPAPAFDSRST
ncbi:unnamed protein product [Euphydryas editha]|uniref:Uncharacterized protein n=1 Tax=Euphydryas editha TaxID=104508 RepID=A0AAU9U8Y3_EUPED|nr:unnamed protein product [Euphydryas editha]